MKTYTKCRLTFLESDFYNNKATLSELDNYCKICRKKYTSNNRGRFRETSRFMPPAKIIISQGNLVCVCCGNKNKQWLQVDHIIPVRRKRGDRNTTETECRKIVLGLLSPFNYQLMCASCNFAKKDNEKCPIDHTLD